MKKITLLPALTLALLLQLKTNAAVWTQVANYTAGGRYAATGFSIGSKGYVTCGDNPLFTHFSDLWEYNPGTDTWTQKANFPGGARFAAGAFTIDTVGYLCVGQGNPGYLTDLWAYYPGSNTWVQKAGFPGSARYDVCVFTLNKFGYVGSGKGGSYYSDFYKYNPANNSWSSAASLPGTARENVEGFSIKGYGYAVGGAVGPSGPKSNLLYRYNDTTDTWTQISSYPGSGSYAFASFVINDIAYIGTGSDLTNAFGDFYQFNPANNSWTAFASFPPGGRLESAYLTIGNCGYMGLGSTGVYPSLTYMNDWWKFDATTGIAEKDEKVSMKIYPNPFSSSTALTLNESAKDATLTVFNSNGQQVKQIDHISGKEIKFQRENLPAGVYILRLTQDGRAIASEQLVIAE